METRTIEQLATTATELENDDLIPIWQNGQTKKISGTNFFKNRSSNAVADYTYSKYDNIANYQKTFTKVGNLGTYTKIVDITAGTNLGYTEDLSNLFTGILSVQISCASYGGRYIDTYWQNTNDASLTIIYTAASDTRMCFQVTGILKENYVEPF